MIRRAPDGRQSLIDLTILCTQTKRENARKMLKRLTDKGILPHYDSVILGSGTATPIVTDEQWGEVRSHLPSDAYMTRHRNPDDLYVMQYSNAHDAVKIGRSYDVEKRRRSLEVGHNFFVTLLAAFPAQGHLESLIHDHLEVFRSSAGAGKEWFNVSKDQAITVIQSVLHKHEECLCAQPAQDHSE